MEDDQSTERVRVTTYVPEYQKGIWEDHAEEMGMSRSEFVRAMVQAGRRGFTSESEDGSTSVTTSHEPHSEPHEQEDEAVTGMVDRVEEVLSTEEHVDWETLSRRVIGDIEDDLEATLQDLQSENRVRYSGRNGGYTLVQSE